MPFATEPRRLDPPDSSTGPGPLSPAFPWVLLPALPEGRLERMAARLRVLQDECRAALLEKGTPFWLGIGRREELVETLEEIRRLNAALPRYRRSRRVEGWPVPVLPMGALFGARDLLPLLDAAITTATLAADEESRLASNPPLA